MVIITSFASYHPQSNQGQPLLLLHMIRRSVDPTLACSYVSSLPWTHAVIYFSHHAMTHARARLISDLLSAAIA